MTRTRNSSPNTKKIVRTRRRRSNRRSKATSQSNVQTRKNKTKCSSESTIELKENLSTISSPKKHENEEINKSKIVVIQEQDFDQFEFNPESTSSKTKLLISSINNVKKNESKKSPAKRTITLESIGYKGFDYMLQRNI